MRAAPWPALLLILALVFGGWSSCCRALRQDASGSHHVMHEVAAEPHLERPITPTFCMLGGGNEGVANIRAVLQMLGYAETADPLQATLLWYTGPAFINYSPYVTREQQAQLLARLRQDPAPASPVVNSHPGIETITSKVELATLSSTLPFLPRTFRMPAQHEQWQAFMDSQEGAGMQWMRKGFGHKDIAFLPDPRSPAHAQLPMLVQQRVQPFLVHKRLWDMGFFVSTTSVDPLVAYIHTGIAVLRLAREEHAPTMTADTHRHTYVINTHDGANLRLDTFEGTQPYFQGRPRSHQPLSACFSYLGSQGVNTTDLLLQAQSHIVQVLASVNNKMREAELKYPAARTNAFMWTRFDFMLAKDHKLYLIEANMSPSLARRDSDSEEVLRMRMAVVHDLLTLNGLSPGGLHHPDTSADLQRLVADPVLLDVEEPACAGSCRDSCSSMPRCVLCHACRDARQNRILQRLQAEAFGAHHFRRIYPPPQRLAAYMQGAGIRGGSPDLDSRPDNGLVATWLQAKCGLEPRFC